MFINPEDKYLIQCKQNYFDKITPSNDSHLHKDGYKELIKIATYYFDNNRYEDFSGFFQEGQYFINLWTAHLLLEHGSPNTQLAQKAFEIIKDYASNPLAPDVAVEEKEWIDKNKVKYGGSVSDGNAIN